MKKFYRRSISGLLAVLICFTTILGSSVTALATSVPAETAKSYSVAFPRNGDANLDMRMKSRASKPLNRSPHWWKPNRPPPTRCRKPSRCRN